MKLAIVGSRFFQDFPFIKKHVIDTINIRTVEKIISGGAVGVDGCAKMVADYYHILFEAKKADWKKYGKAAGPIRNRLIIDDVDVVIAFWDGRVEHCGTYDDINYCTEIGRTCHVIRIGEKNE